ncbi:MAG: LysM peptidoglycan-binding domain-containing protein [Anaerolineae bacterium]
MERNQPDPSEQRCPHCDSVVADDAKLCLMCGKPLTPPALPDASSSDDVEKAPPIPEAALPEPEAAPPIFESKMRERGSRAAFWITAVFTVFIVILGSLILRFQSPTVTVALVPTSTPVPPTPTLTPTWTPLPTQTQPPTSTPTITPTPAPTDTPRPPRLHAVTSGETLIGLALRYGVLVDSIAQANGFNPDAPIQVGQNLVIPWPTPTPPLVPVAVEINGETVVADPDGCDRYEIRGGDTLSAVASRYDLDQELFDLFLQVNRLSEQSILQPGDTVCIPTIVYGGTLLSTPGPTPTPSPTAPPPGPTLLYPIDGAAIEPPDGILRLQWVAVKDLAPEESYMVELRDLDEVNGLPHRGFTRDTSFAVPGSWRPTVPQVHTLQWRVSIVVVTGQRADGQPIYRYGGESSEPSTFTWLGAVPTATPLPTATATATPNP